MIFCSLWITISQQQHSRLIVSLHRMIFCSRLMTLSQHGHLPAIVKRDSGFPVASRGCHSFGSRTLRLGRKLPRGNPRFQVLPSRNSFPSNLALARNLSSTDPPCRHFCGMVPLDFEISFGLPVIPSKALEHSAASPGFCFAPELSG